MANAHDFLDNLVGNLLKLREQNLRRQTDKERTANESRRVGISEEMSELQKQLIQFQLAEAGDSREARNAILNFWSKGGAQIPSNILSKDEIKQFGTEGVRGKTEREQVGLINKLLQGDSSFIKSILSGTEQPPHLTQRVDRSKLEQIGKLQSILEEATPGKFASAGDKFLSFISNFLPTTAPSFGKTYGASERRIQGRAGQRQLSEIERLLSNRINAGSGLLNIQQ